MQILTILSLFFTRSKNILWVALVVGSTLFVIWGGYQIFQAFQERASLSFENAQLESQVDALQTELEVKEAIIARAQENARRAQERVRALEPIRRDVINVPEDSPIGPALQRALDGLRGDDDPNP